MMISERLIVCANLVTSQARIATTALRTITVHAERAEALGNKPFYVQCLVVLSKQSPIPKCMQKHAVNLKFSPHSPQPNKVVLD
jgi:hypothetical protein